MWGDELFVRHTTELEGEEIQRELKAVFDAVGASNGRVPVSVVVSSPVFDEFFRSIAVYGEGERGEQELDTRMLRYDLLGKNNVKQAIQHAEL